MNKLNFILFAISILLVSSFVYAGGLPVFHAPRIHVKDGTSTNWSGYAALTSLSSPKSGAVSDVKGSWVVPYVDCSSTPSAYSSFWIGIDGYSSGTVEQTGTDSDCSSGTARYYAWYEMYPKFPVSLNLKISPGDTINAEAQYIGSNNFKLTIVDATTGNSFSTTQKLAQAKRSSAEWIAEAPSSGSVLPLANFGTVSFLNSQATLNGHTGTISDSAWQNDAITMVTSSGIAKAVPSGLTNGGSAFSVVWQHS